MTNIQKVLAVGVLLAAIWQVYAVGVIAIDAFTENAFFGQLNYIQPVGFIFSIWGLIYALAFAFAIYQLFPQNNSRYLEYARPLVIAAFSLSGFWLFFAAQDLSLRWITVPVLIAIAYALYHVIVFQKTTVQGKTMWERLLSTYALYPYAAWTLIASGVNIHSILIQYGIVSDVFWNVFASVFLLVLVTILSWITLKQVTYSPWYGLVLVWATFGIVWTNIIEPDGALLIAIAAGLVSLWTALLVIKHCSLDLVSKKPKRRATQKKKA
jgi:hypothetical protein